MKPKTVDVLEVLKKLPAESYVWDVSTPGVSVVKRGVRGHYPQIMPAELRYVQKRGDYAVLHKAGRAFVAEMNKRAGVTPAQAQAMHAGSMFGWELPCADPDSYEGADL